MRALRLHFIAFALCVPGFFAELWAQDLSLTRPGSLNLFHPFSYADESYFTPLPFRLSGYAKIGYDDNVFAQHTGAIGSVYNEFGLSAGVNIGNERTQLTSNILAGIVAYWQRPGKKVDPDFNLGLAFNHQFSERTVFNLASSVSYQAQPNFASGAGAPNVVATFLDASNKISLGFQWTPRIAAFTSYSLDLIYYDSRSIGQTEDRFEHLISEEIRYLLRPAIVAVGEYRFGTLHYLYTDIANSHSHYFLGGSDVFLSPRLKFAFRAGVQLQQFVAQSESELSYPYAESTLTFLYRPESTIDWYNRYGLEAPDNAQSSYRKTFRTGLKIAHQFGGKTVAVAAAYYSHNEYRGSSPFTENLVEANLELTYQITRKLRLVGGYTFTRDFSNMVSRDYVRNRIYSGVSYAF
jgi:Putative beta-barrel porin 2